ncbi:MAG: Dihydroneopterin aldolase (EC [uncultured Thiotrichaceae bacterium]|uniref:7,8-dihydroneopterin aldolase n=1 Tax=uncultured Thiotrichaceae bacterium TaxID=298394 RepID=A0A6S6TAA8_9GAMM|nr:MAG: Dihydroneopterin aldolase (EC [uncultured Thiotrichaceae bacterium]
MDIVYIRDLKIDANIGIYAWEKAIKQKIRIDLEMAWDNTVPAASDDIADALNYKETAQKVTELVQSQHFDLVERLAEEIAAMLMRDMKVSWLRLTLGKPGAVKSSSEVGVRIERGER